MHRSVTILTLLAMLVTLSSHELFLKSDSFFLKSNSESELYLFNGTFDESENIITRDRIIDPRILGPKYEHTPDSGAYYDNGPVTYLKFKTGKPGTYVAGISTRARGIELSGTEFTAYLEHEGLTQVIAERKAKGISDQAADEKYSKHVKAILQVDDKHTDHYAKVLGYPIEFIPLNNPYEVSPGDEISFRLLYQGAPLGGQTVHVSSRKGQAKEGQETARSTDENGEVRFKITNPGQWYVAAIYMMDSPEEAYDYESNWATLTFEVK